MTVENRQQVEAALSRSQAAWSALMETIPALILIHRGGQCQYANIATETILGHAREQVFTRPLWEFVHPDYRETVRARANRREAGEEVPTRYEFPILTASGELRWLDCSVHRIEFEGQPAVLVCALDITRRKEEEEKTRSSEERFRQVVEHIHEVFWMTDLNKEQMIYISPSYEEIWGRSRASLYTSPRNWMEAVHPADRARVQEAALTRQPRGDYHEVYRIVRPDGTMRWIEDRAFVVRNAEGDPYRIAGIAEDITERKQALIALEESEERFALFMRHLPCSAWMKDVQGRIIFVNAEAERVGHRSLAELRGKTGPEIFPPATASQFQENDAKALATGQCVEATELLPLDDGIHHTVVRKFPIFGREGTAIMVGGVSFDITDRLRTEERLRESEVQFRTLFESAPMGIALHNADGRYLHANRFYQEMLGYSEEELIHLPPDRVIHPEDLGEEQRFRRDLLEGRRESYQREKRFLRKDGHVVWGRSAASAVRNPGGALLHVISMVEDVTGHKQASRLNIAFAKLGLQLSGVSTARDAANVIVGIASDLFGWDACYLHLYSQEKNLILPVLTMDTIKGCKVDVPESNFTLDPSPLMLRVMLEGARLINREDLSPAPGFVPLVRFGDESRLSASMMYVPVRHGSAVLGILSIQSYTPHAYASQDLEALQALADHCGGALGRIHAAMNIKRLEQQLLEFSVQTPSRGAPESPN